MPLVSGDGMGNDRRAHVDPRDGKLKDSRDFARERTDRDRKEPVHREERREPVTRSEPPKESVMSERMLGDSRVNNLANDDTLIAFPSSNCFGSVEKPLSMSSSNSDPNAVLNSVSKSLTGNALKLGFGAALGCATAAVPIPVVQEIGIGTCVFGGIAAAGTALAGHNLEPQEPKK